MHSPDSETQAAAISVADFTRLVATHMPLAQQLGIAVDDISYGCAKLSLAYQTMFLRSGGSIAGPVIMGLADLAVYGAVLSIIGQVELTATTHLNINFLRKSKLGDIHASAKILKLGQRLAVGEALIYSKQSPQAIAQATCTYSIPPKKHWSYRA